MSFSRDELLKDVKEEELSPEQLANFEVHVVKMNKLRAAYGKRLKVTSGVRSMKKHLQIYKNKGITDTKKIPMKSKHLSAQASDIIPLDESIEEFQQWILDNPEIMEEIDLYFEDFNFSPTWIHVQSVPFGSYKPGGTRMFKP
jgi:hypothetical protein